MKLALANFWSGIGLTAAVVAAFRLALQNVESDPISQPDKSEMETNPVEMTK